jgi:hypothetical protein
MFAFVSSIPSLDGRAKIDPIKLFWWIPALVVVVALMGRLF